MRGVGGEMSIHNFFQPTKLEECFELMEKYHSYQIIAGGTDLLVKHFANGQDIACLIDISRIKSLQGIAEDGEQLRIGALATHDSIVRDEKVSHWADVLAQACKTVGSPQIRSVATLGGNIVNASPAADGVTALAALHAVVEIQSKCGERLVPIEAFITGPGTTDLKKGEVLTGIIVPKYPVGDYRHYYLKSGQRQSLAIAKVSLAAIVRLDAQNVVSRIRLACGAVGPTVICPTNCEKYLMGKSLTDDVLAAAQEIIMQEVRPIDDIRSTVEYRRHMIGQYLKFVLQASKSGSEGKAVSGL